MEIIFNLADRFRRVHSDGTIEIQPANIVTGQMRSSVSIGPSGDVHLFGIRFQPAGAYPFFRFALSELTDRIEDLDAVWGPDIGSIADRLFATNDFSRRAAMIEDILARRLSEQRQERYSIGTIVDAMTREHGIRPVAMIAKEFGVGERNLERQFNERIGLAPKTFSRIVRFQRVLKMLESDENTDFVEASLAHGYFDQPHMINDFRQFAGASPMAFLQKSHRLTEFFTAGK